MLTIPLETLAFIVEKAREFDAEVPGEGDASDAADDRDAAILEDTDDNPTLEELRDAIDALNIDEREELLALVWLGRGDFATWREALAAARDTDTARESDYLIGTPLLADYVEEGLSALGLSLEGLERG